MAISVIFFRNLLAAFIEEYAVRYVGASGSVSSVVCSKERKEIPESPLEIGTTNTKKTFFLIFSQSGLRRVLRNFEGRPCACLAPTTKNTNTGLENALTATLGRFFAQEKNLGSFSVEMAHGFLTLVEFKKKIQLDWT